MILLMIVGAIAMTLIASALMGLEEWVNRE